MRDKNIFNLEGFMLSSTVKESQRCNQYLLGTLRVNDQNIDFTCFKKEAFKILSDYQGAKISLSGYLSTFRDHIQLIVNGAKNIN